jgi:hypothetical protein
MQAGFRIALRLAGMTSGAVAMRVLTERPWLSAESDMLVLSLLSSFIPMLAPEARLDASVQSTFSL